MNKQIEAQRLADELDTEFPHYQPVKDAANQLRCLSDLLTFAVAEQMRLHDLNKELLQALFDLERTAGQSAMHDDPARVTARAAIAKATGEQA